MPAYICEGFDHGLKPVMQRLEAASVADAVARLQREQISVTRVRRDWQQLLHSQVTNEKPKLTELVAFCRQLATMIATGIPVVRGLRVLADLHTGRRLGRVALETAQHLEDGVSFADALQKNAWAFTPVMLRMIGAAELTGNLDQALNQLADQFEQEEYFRSKVISAMTYPAIVLAVAVAGQVLILTLIMPRFAAIYHDLGTPLPASTQFLMGISSYLVAYGWTLPLIVIALWLLAGLAVRKVQVLRLLLARLELTAPIIGPLNRRRQSARFVRTFAGLYGSGVPIVTAMEFAAGSLSNPLLVDVVRQAAARAAHGGTLVPPFQQSRLFPPIMVEMLAIGEETGTVDTMLLRAASQSELEARITLERLTSVLEPVLVLILTGSVGAVLIPTLLPILTLANTFSQTAG